MTFETSENLKDFHIFSGLHFEGYFLNGNMGRKRVKGRKIFVSGKPESCLEVKNGDF